MAPHKSVFDLNAPKVVSKNLSIPDTVVSTIACWLHYPNEHVDPVKDMLMEQLADKRNVEDRRNGNGRRAG